MIGKIISHYKIISKLGEGGMGVLYLADDVNINRKAVLKFLPPDVTNDPDINSRFKREAQTAGSLSHPNIVTIYDVGTHENRSFIAMEYIEGKTLRDLLNSDELTAEKIINISVQVCEGLNEAHSKGIIHRDIKPENIIIDEKGRVKILDFGLARVKGKTHLTKDGSTLGTVKYMSPEQIRNEKVDQRTDIWSVGIMLYEMITRRYPFKGEHEASLFYAIINDQPEPIARYKSGISEGFQRIIDKALDKDPETRYQHIDDLLSDLKREKRESSESIIINKSSYEKIKKTKKREYIIAASILIILLLVFIAYYLLNNKMKIIKSPKHTQLTFDGNIYIYFPTDFTQISPDGKYTAYVMNKGNEQSLCVKENFSGKTNVIYNAKNIWCLRWSPDNNEIFFTASGIGSDHLDQKIAKNYSSFIISKSGGTAHTIDVQEPTACWSSDGNNLAFIFLSNDSIKILDKKTQNWIRKIKLNGDYTQFYDIDWAPAVDRFTCLTFNNNNKKYNIWTIKTDGTEQRKVIESEKDVWSPRWSANGNDIYYLQERKGTRDLMKIEISSDGTVEGKPKIILTGLEAYGFSISNDNKKFVYTKDVTHSNIWKLSLEKGKNSYHTKKLTNGTTYIYSLAISPDGKKIAFGNQGNIFIKSIDDKEMRQLTTFDSDCLSPTWSPDGKEIAFFSGSNIILIDAYEGIIQKKFKNVDFGSNLYWYSDSIIFYNDPEDFNFFIFNMKTGEKKKFLENDKNMGWINNPLVSPDKERIAVFWNRWNDETLDGLWIISKDDSMQNHLIWGNIRPIEWSRDGQYIYAINYDKIPTEIIKVSAENGNIKESIKMPFDKVVGADITPDGKTILFTVEEENSDVWMIENFDPDIE